MSSGHSAHWTDKHLAELGRIRSTPWFQKANALPRKLFRQVEIPWLGGSSTSTLRIYVDHRFAGSATYRSTWAMPIDVGIFLPALIEHEVIEAILLVFGQDKTGKPYEYDGAHEIATAAEETAAQRILSKHGLVFDREAYQEIYKPFVKVTQTPPWQNLPPDLNLEPYRQDDASLYHDIERALLRSAITAGGKVSKQEANYGPGMPQSHCGICAHYAGTYSCELVRGYIDPQKWCKFFAKRG